MNQINKPNEINNIVPLKRDENIVLIRKGDRYNAIGSFYFSQWSDMKETKAFIKNIEKQIRTSKEYRTYIGHLNNEIGLHHCSVFGNLTDDIDGLTLEFHHYPFTLYDIVEICVNRRIIEDEDFTSLDIANEVLKLHEANKVGLVKLSKTAHELVHDGKLYIKLNSIFGDVKSFVDEYLQFIPEDVLMSYNDLIDMNEKNYDESIIKS